MKKQKYTNITNVDRALFKELKKKGHSDEYARRRILEWKIKRYNLDPGTKFKSDLDHRNGYYIIFTLISVLIIFLIIILSIIYL